MQPHQHALENASRLINSIEMHNNICLRQLLGYVHTTRHMYRLCLSFVIGTGKLETHCEDLKITSQVTDHWFVRLISPSAKFVTPFQDFKNFFFGGGVISKLGFVMG